MSETQTTQSKLPADWEEIVRAGRRQGQSLSEIGERLGVSRERVRQLEADLGLPARSRLRSKFDQQLVEDAIAIARREALPATRIARRLGVPPSRLGSLRTQISELDQALSDSKQRWHDNLRAAKTRVCYRCQHEKPLDEFHRYRRDLLGRNRICKSCVADQK